VLGLSQNSVCTVYAQIFEARKFCGCHKFRIFAILFSRMACQSNFVDLTHILFYHVIAACNMAKDLTKDITYYFKRCLKHNVLKLSPDISESTIVSAWPWRMKWRPWFAPTRHQPPPRLPPLEYSQITRILAALWLMHTKFSKEILRMKFLQMISWPWKQRKLHPSKICTYTVITYIKNIHHILVNVGQGLPPLALACPSLGILFWQWINSSILKSLIVG